jgi:uncharacterized protein (DUF1810 family)
LGDDPFDLQRFILAQDPALKRVRAELMAGRKISHWMWFVFPQIIGLSQSSMSQRFAVRSLAEAKAYLAHPVLGPRLLECSELVNHHADHSVAEIFGFPDDVKFQACMTLFWRASGNKTFQLALQNFFEGNEHSFTVKALASSL